MSNSCEKFFMAVLTWCFILVKRLIRFISEFSVRNAPISKVKQARTPEVSLTFYQSGKQILKAEQWSSLAKGEPRPTLKPEKSIIYPQARLTWRRPVHSKSSKAYWPFIAPSISPKIVNIAAIDPNDLANGKQSTHSPLIVIPPWYRWNLFRYFKSPSLQNRWRLMKEVIPM